MYIDNKTKLRVNIHAPYKGYSRLDTEDIREAADVVEIAEPSPPVDYDSDYWHKTEQDVEPYVVFTKKSEDHIAAIRWNKIKQLRDDLTESGGCFVAGKWFHSDTKSKQQQMALVMVGAALPSVPWKTMDGSFITLTPEVVSQVFQAQMLREQTIFAVAEAKRVDSAADLNTGWPSRYVENEV